MSKFMSKLTKKSSSSKKFEGAVECTDFECVTFQDKPYQIESRPITDTGGQAQHFTEPSCRFERGETRQSFNEGADSKFSGRLNQSSIATVNNLNANDRRLSQSHVFGVTGPAAQISSNDPPLSMQHQDQIANLQRKRPGSARYARPGAVNGAKHGSSSSLSSASSASSVGSYSNNIGNGFGHPEHAELIQSINESLNQLSMVEDMQDLMPANAPPKPKRPSTDRVKTTMAFYANKPSFSSDNRQPLRQSSLEEESPGGGGGMTTTVSNHSNSTNSLHNNHLSNVGHNNNNSSNISPHASSTTINSTHSNCSQHGQRVHVCKHFIQGNKKALTEILKMLNTRHTVKDDLSSKNWSDYLVCSARVLADTERQRACYKVRCANTDNLVLPHRVYLAKIQCPTQQDAQQRMCFENDFKISSALPPHPNITTSYSRFTDKVPENLPDFPSDSAGRTNCTFVIADFLSEGNLRSFVKDNQHLLEHRVEEYEYEVCLLLLQLFRALHHLHENKAVHRDLKLENVSVGAADHPGGGKRLSLCNFGYSLYQPEKPEPFIVNPDDNNTWLGGNIAHLPPEILNPSEEITELDYTKSDVFGAGCMIYEMLNLMNPFEGEDSLIKKVYSQSDLPLIPKRSRYSYALDRLVCLLLRHKPSKRISAKRAGDLVEVMLWGPEELRGSDRAAAEQMAAEWLEQQRSEILSSLALKLAENFTPQGSRVQNSAGFSLEDELKCKFLRETSARALTTNLYLLSQCQRAQQRGV